jgi:hypothetical protein
MQSTPVFRLRRTGGCVPYRPGYETALWVLTQARGSRWSGRVLLADVSDRPLTADVVWDLAEDVVTWRRDGYVPRAHHWMFACRPTWVPWWPLSGRGQGW